MEKLLCSGRILQLNKRHYAVGLSCKLWERVLEKVKMRDPHQMEFLQAVHEVVADLDPVFRRNPKYIGVFERLVEPERIVQFRVPWVDDRERVHVNRGFRVQFSSTLGPYKGGLRFSPHVTMSVIKFLGFEQIFKNALTTLPLGAGKGGSDFNPKGKSDMEVMKFCQSFMTELEKHIGPHTDVPAGDLGVGAREIGFLFGQCKRIRNAFQGTLTGKGIDSGGSLIRPEATGYGVVFFLEEILKSRSMPLEGKRVCVSGSGNVAQFCVERLLMNGAVPVTMSDTSGYIYEPEGITREQLKSIVAHKSEARLSLLRFSGLSKNGMFVPSPRKPWEVKCDIAIPCAKENELQICDAKTLDANGCKCVIEGANMPSTLEAIRYFQKQKVMFAPAKAANAGGVAVSGLEMVQNSMGLFWKREEVENKLKEIMSNIHSVCLKTSVEYGEEGNLLLGANVSSFLKVGNAMREQGIV